MARLKVLFVVGVLVSALATSVAGCTTAPKLSTSTSPVGAGTVSPSQGTYQTGVVVNVTATPASGYRFDHWEGGASGTSATIQVTMDTSRSLVAYFTKVYALSVTASPASGGTVSPASGAYDAGRELTLMAMPAQYYKFNGWAGDASGSSDHLTVTMDSNKQISASFVKLMYPVLTQADPPGSGSVNPASGTFEAGSQQMVSATPAAGYRFDHWGGDASGTSNPLSLLINASKTVTASFVRQYRLTISCDPASGNVSQAGGTYDAGTRVSLNTVHLGYFVVSF